jgi:hypothetical protein
VVDANALAAWSVDCGLALRGRAGVSARPPDRLPWTRSSSPREPSELPPRSSRGRRGSRHAFPGGSYTTRSGGFRKLLAAKASRARPRLVARSPALGSFGRAAPASSLGRTGGSARGARTGTLGPPTLPVGTLLSAIVIGTGDPADGSPDRAPELSPSSRRGTLKPRSCSSSTASASRAPASQRIGLGGSVDPPARPGLPESALGCDGRRSSP